MLIIFGLLVECGVSHWLFLLLLQSPRR